ncbi:MAG: protein translocase subunit SecD [Verrucomicrobiota bacterium]|nr:protein translocase subunit SecD [Limisphaera sp.]MDW8382269.1 protein translocase subunit SecD [Verrucomicrobiota bacterium]
MRRYTWKWLVVLLVTAGSLYSLYPPTSRDLVQVFRERAVNKDATFSNIWYQVTQLQQQRPDRAYGNLLDAIGTNDIRRYFPFFNVEGEAQPTLAILNRLQREAAGKIRLGLDLRGGTSFLLEMDTNRLATVETVTNRTGEIEFRTNYLSESEVESALAQAVEVLRRRVDKFGVAEPVIQPAGRNRILVQLPGLSEADRLAAQRQLQRAAFLEFRLVHERSDELLREGLIEPGYEVLTEERRNPDGTKTLRRYLVKKRPERGMTGAYVKSAMVTLGNLGEPEILFQLTREGAELFAQITRENQGRQLAIVLDGVLYSAPVIREPILTGSGSITGNFDLREAMELANVLENPLRAPLRVVETRDVDPTLGADSIRSGIRACIVGGIAVCAFMLVYYLFAGLVANAALCLNLMLLLGVMCSIGTTLTLPGIAGIVLTVGMAVDANVLIFERIREELAAGKSLRGAIAAGYDKAFGTILDANLTTLIASVILIYMGTGPVKGFGVTLTIGLAVSMFTALVVTRLIFDTLLDRGWVRSLRMLKLIGPTRFDFLRWAKPAFIASWLLILIGNGYGIFIRGQDVLGVEFTGGANVTLAFDPAHRVEVDRLRTAATAATGGDVLVGYQKDLGTGTETLRITARVPSNASEDQVASLAQRLVEALQQQFPQAQWRVLSVDTIGPVIGQEILRSAVWAAALAMFGILIYLALRYEFPFALGAVVAIVHDLLMTLGWYFLAQHQMNATTVAALLTIIGFSVNDTVVIFDRIREDLKLGMRGSFRDIMNHALNQTLSRTLITSGTTFLATLALYGLGGPVINDFAFTFLVGILTGTYSSIYIASALVLWWYKGQRPAIGQPVAGQPVVSSNATLQAAPSRT